MAEKSITAKLRDELAATTLPEGVELDVLTSSKLIKRILPVANAFVKANVDTLSAHKDKTNSAIIALAEKILKDVDIKEDPMHVISDMMKGAYSPDALDAIWKDLRNSWFFGPMTSFALIAVNIVSFALSYFSVSAEKTKQTAQEDIRPYLLDLPTMMREYFRDPNRFNWLQSNMRKMGIKDKDIQTFIDNNRSFIPLDMLVNLWHREEISSKRLVEGLKANMFREDDIETMQAAFFQYPGIQDIITMAVREVFSPELADQLGLYADMPQEFIVEAKKAGLPEKYARMHWAAHWQPGSVNQYFEMFHRGVIDEDKLRNLLRINDVMPNLRDDLISISYRPILRIDLRRMYSSRLIDFERLVKGNMNLGYTREDAELIATWTDEEYKKDNKDITKTDILSLYKLGHIEYRLGLAYLVDAGYSEFAAEDMLLKVDLQEAEKEQSRLIKLYKKSFLLGTAGISELQSKLLSAGLQTKEINVIIAEWELEYKEKIKYLTASQVEKLYKKEVWERQESIDYMIKIGYSEYDSTSLATLWDLEFKSAEG